MTKDEIFRLHATPVDAPPYPLNSYRFYDREYLNIFYRTDPEALRHLIPEPLVFEEPIVRFEIMNMREVGGYGPYCEAGQAIPVKFGEQRGEYVHSMYLDNLPATIAGRDLGSYPKTMARPALRVQDGALIGTLDAAGERVATATMGYKHYKMNPELAREQIAKPIFMLDLVRGHGLELLQCGLVRGGVEELVIKEAWHAPARLQLFEHVLAPLADLPVLEIIEASHIITDLTLAMPEPVHNYLTDSRK